MENTQREIIERKLAEARKKLEKIEGEIAALDIQLKPLQERWAKAQLDLTNARKRIAALDKMLAD